MTTTQLPEENDLLILAEEEARRLRNNYIGTEHLLLGLLRLRSSVGYQLLDMGGIPIQQLQKEVERQSPRGRTPVNGDVGMTHLARLVLRNAQSEADRLGKVRVGGEHILLALLDQEQGVARRVLVQFRVTREAVLEALEARVGTPPVMADRTETILGLAREVAITAGGGKVEPVHLLQALAQYVHSFGVVGSENTSLEQLMQLMGKGKHP